MGLDEIKAFFNEQNIVVNYGGRILKLLIILIGMKVLTYFGNIIIEKFIQNQKQHKLGMNERKLDTLSELLKSILRYALYILGIINGLDVLGFPIGTLLVGAGLGGVAIGFGAQSLIKDIIAGFFILFEDQFSVGEYVTIENMEGIVEGVGLRITKIKDFSGDLHIIPNGLIGKVTNHSRDNARALVEFDIGYDVNIDKALSVLNKLCEDIKNTNENIIEGPSVLGVTDLGEYGVKLKIAARTKPMEQWGVEREIRKKVKDVFEAENINIPFPTRVIITKNGNNS
ncbi:putative MscS family protein YkuT [Oxobacter pfennigii]|uniref:Putative MscS family protein YkuT n=1 Tax=Oxobacter pfennigii TaxID=36849 RepID=A0A0P8W5I7_9CLOT|nr:mechanosensitive ion channel family protein [Oxobacter pfennigii]KPU42907.1 putative MscS family protein YkuT [Oxobacter pfennigii]